MIFSGADELTFLQKILYSRLSLFKGISTQLVISQESKSKSTSPEAATDVGRNETNGSESTSNKNPDLFYEMLLGLCERLFENEVEQHLFEDQTRAVFGLEVCLVKWIDASD